MTIKDYFILCLTFILLMMATACINETVKGCENGRAPMSYSEADREYLAHLIYAEAGSQGRKCMTYVGSVVMNRVKSDKYPNSIVSVIHQPGQYSTAYDANKPSKEAYYIAEELLRWGSQLPEYVLYQHWKRPVIGTKEYCHIGNEYFSY